jgi:hypothetical protein
MTRQFPQMEKSLSRQLTDDDVEAICVRLQEFSGLTPEEHRDHHNAFAAYIEAQRRKVEFREKIKQQVGGWVIISVLSFIGYAAWNSVASLLGKGGG